MDARQVVDHLGLEPHPEGGWYRETWRDEAADGERASGSAIYFLLDAGERSHWHRVDAAEAWHHYAGGPLELAVFGPGHASVVRLGPDLRAHEQPQAVVPAWAWQAARPVSGWVLVGCTVSPAFEFAGFELAAPDWAPDGWPHAGW